MSRRHLILCLLFVSLWCTVQANNNKKEPGNTPECIVNEIMADSINVVEMPADLWDLIDFEPATPSDKKPDKTVNPRPYTVQVYGDKSRNEANARASKVQGRFPQYHVRRHYASPYFRVYLGAFETSREAQVLVNEVKKAFPAFANEVHWTKTSTGAPSKKRR